MCSKYYERHIDQRNRIDSPEISLYVYRLLLFDKGAKDRECMIEFPPFSLARFGEWASHCLIPHSSVQGYLRQCGTSPRALIWLLALFASWTQSPISRCWLRIIAQALLQTKLKSISQIHLSSIWNWYPFRPKFHVRREVKIVEFSFLLEECIILGGKSPCTDWHRHDHNSCRCAILLMFTCRLN